ncbi:DUF2891 domain-containing protein [Aurantiacibacter gangjinensis]|uniref:Uncharacterized protein n=1 Tax=Aurantiacibacter gangjinensis TaxID=502682 RepID=A0A0G9MM37_9SPHN|nr:DUF2891 domain-containing protein [Aurantiacibacter gangjinensis]APE27810.1 hypothetical protein BMF35_a0981 [Aurantiacibacter gangjinensis]KLE31796.1 hypothetical protein AAW01_09880 [Aurantiacibacter gangjinensis]
MQLTPDLASRFACTALGHVAREYPNKLDHVMAGDGDARMPRDLHPAFFGSFDWHSCVHSWWMLLRVARLYPDMAEAGQIRALADQTFTEAKLATELAYAQRPQSRGFERPYGWAWLLYLHLEASRADAPWAERLRPLAEHFANGFRDYLSILRHPITTGTHFNTAFALTLALEWAETFDAELAATIRDWSTDHFGERQAYAGWEPGGDEFLSPVLSVALLMGRVLDRDAFADWFARLLPEDGWLETQCKPVKVSDVTDGKMAHLDGLNLSRAWALHRMAGLLGDKPRAARMRDMADAHIAASIDAVDGHYMSAHWLASFALLALEAAENRG